MQSYKASGSCPSRRLRRMAAFAVAVLLLLPWQVARGGVITIYSDNFLANPLGSVPAAPLVGQPWQTSATTPGGIKVVLDLASSANALQLGPYRSTVVMAFSGTNQSLMAADQNVSFAFQYHGISSLGFTPFLDIRGDNTTTGNPAFLFRVMSQPTAPSSGLHEIYYLNPTTGLTDTGLSVPADSLQLLTVSTDFATSTSQLSVGSSAVTLPLYTCPSMIQDVSLSSYMIGSGGISYSNIDQVTATTNSPTTGVQPGNSQVPTPEPGMLSLLAAALAGPAAWWLWRKSNRRETPRQS